MSKKTSRLSADLIIKRSAKALLLAGPPLPTLHRSCSGRHRCCAQRGLVRNHSSSAAEEMGGHGKDRACTCLATLSMGMRVRILVWTCPGGVKVLDKAFLAALRYWSVRACRAARRFWGALPCTHTRSVDISSIASCFSPCHSPQICSVATLCRRFISSCPHKPQECLQGCNTAACHKSGCPPQATPMCR